MIKIAVYGKGGIGKSTTVSNVAVALAEKGLKVMQIGCDPKADSTIALRHGEAVPTVLDLFREKKQDLKLEDMVRTGYQGVICVEAGGPTPGLGCAGRGIITALEKLKETGAYEVYQPDVVLYDVLGDVVCGGFSMPMRKGYADKVFIITSGENMAIHAGANIAMAVENFKNRGYASLGGIILNRRNVAREEEKVNELADDFQTQVVGTLSHSGLVTEAEEKKETVMECFPDSEMAEEYRKLAEAIYELSKRPEGSACEKANEKYTADKKTWGGIEMLKKAGESTGLEFNSPAHGNWNIVHTGMLLPESIQIYVCADNCMRGVVLTAAEMNAADRFSFVIVEEEDLLNGNMEDVTIEGVTDVLRKRKDHPKAVLLFTVCLHHFLGCDLERVYEELEARFPDIFFVRCYMDPIMQKHGLTPDQKLRKAIYDGLKVREENPKAVTILGSDFALDETSDIRRLLKWKHIEVKELPECNSWKSYQELADSKIFIACYPPGKYGLECQAERLRKKALYLPGSFDYDEIIRQWKTLEQAVGENVEEVEGIEDTDMHMEKSLERITKREIALCESALEQARKVVGDVPIMIDHTFHPRPLELAKLLLTHGFSVTRIYLDAVNPEEKDTFEWLKEQYPELEYEPTIRPEMRMKPRNESDVLAIGQKAAWFTGTRHFVNLVEGAGLYGFDGIRRMAELMTEAWQEEKDPEDLIIRKGWGCESCI